MKKVFLLILIFIILLTYCSNERNTVNTATKKVMQLPNRMRTTNDIIEIKNAVNEYYSDNLMYPENLEILNLDLYYPLENYIYDKNTGIVKSKHYKNL